MAPSGKWAIAIHGGAGALNHQIDTTPYHEALEKAVDAAYRILDDGYNQCAMWAQDGVPTPSTALLAALQAVEVMEANTLFNAVVHCTIGRGAVLNEHAIVENEAAVMDGTTMRTGAVCGLSTVVHPARLAAVVQTVSKYQFLGFSAAERFADRFPALIERQPNDWFITERRARILAKAQGGAQTRKHRAEEMDNDARERAEAGDKCGETVGATVCDGSGHVACVTSTGGVTNKCDGRIGDTPVIGAGSYASDTSCAVSGTGVGEEFLRLSAASRVCLGMELGGMSLKDAMHAVVHQRFAAETGGFVGVTSGGEVVMDLNSDMMFRACRNWQGQRTVATW